MADQKYDFGRGARMMVSRAYLGLSREEMAAALGVRNLSSYQRWEGGQNGIPVGIWAEVDKLLERFDQQVTDLLEKAGGGPLRVQVTRGRTKDRPFPGMWLRVVSEAMRENPKIEPVFPEDDRP
ncbi:helix-turn-helix domain-containing protein [Nocardia sp. CDC159]|uniref:Helix-turn-helix domain-containing protein n=1 Tax=Nocardia pulmonis TaxID=2951408 RepID=A0A9X2ECM0_9NOCA|nr:MULTISPECIES: helix-turn-helix domain-containing protein [Nocardia]MCM6777906.1 helix-turn-helix domain-containing protein [Nocardia pulmonis]MCM6790923.1 helix-turn-helix domain-containing protein [Nocardia sp. CDC159]